MERKRCGKEEKRHKEGIVYLENKGVARLGDGCWLVASEAGQRVDGLLRKI